jgi:NAD(P)-dependent dehydrogenase (short-subunit alcohol dehydrogenase family)
VTTEHPQREVVVVTGAGGMGQAAAQIVAVDVVARRGAARKWPSLFLRSVISSPALN